VLGPAFTDVEKTMTTLRGLDPNINVFKTPRDISLIMVQADIAVSAFGVSAPELAAHGVPTVYLCPTEDHALSASAFAEAGFGTSLGEMKELNPQAVQSAVRYLLDHPEERRQMGAAARIHIDGRGAERVAALIAQRLEARAKGATATPIAAKAS
jgi:spore coat polysaccharide biosynthesis predicted glycosyltransferase SpsG